jgi:hypothetical protein
MRWEENATCIAEKNSYKILFGNLKARSNLYGSCVDGIKDPNNLNNTNGYQRNEGRA